jgi:phosphate-selective porin OprO and OprP
VKRISTTAAALLAATFTGQTAYAKTLEDVLEEKGVISEKERKEIATTDGKEKEKADGKEKKEAVKATPSYTLGKGFTFASDDERFQLYIGGRIQGRYTFTAKRDGAEDVSEWRARRVKLWLGGHVYTKDLTFYVQTELAATAFGSAPATSQAAGQTAAKLIDWAYLNYRFLDEIQILVGQHKIPFGRQWLASAGSLQFIERIGTSDFYRPDYDIGVKLNGKIAKGIVSYDVGTYGGKGKGIFSASNRNSFAGRVMVDPLGYLGYGEADLGPTAKPLVSVGANYFFDRLAASTSSGTLALEPNNLALSASNGFLSSVTARNGFRGEIVNIHLAGVDAAVKWMGFFGTGELFFGKITGSSSHAVVHTRGYYVQGGYCFIPRTLEVAFRYGTIDPNRDVKSDLRHELGGAISYYIVKHNLKLQGDVSDLYDRAQTVNRNNMQYRAQVQMDF